VTGGTYTLLLELPEATTIAVGALGEHRFPAGWYAYTGSAFGSGGFGRVDRHYELAAGERETRHWHIDYLLGHPDSRIRGDVRTPETDIECAVAETLPDGPIDGFGASDCDCVSHLAYDEDGADLRAAVAETHRQTPAE
jgi:endonuclease-3